ncbi:MAG: 5'-nucleotidase C-terminal domain-containing protein [Candidatus Eisenbacteria bacterium]
MNARSAPAAALLLAAVLLSSCSTAPRGHELTILGTADLQGQLEPYVMEVDADGDGVQEEIEAGGISRIATLIRQVEDERPGAVAVVSVGDDLMNRYFHTFKGKAIFELMSAAGYEIYAFGNHEFDKGPEVLAAALEPARFECVCTDLVVEGTPMDGTCSRLLLKDYDGLTVGFFSLMTEGFPYVTSGKGVKLSGTNLETAGSAVAELRERGAQLVVGLTHLGLERDSELAASVPGIDIIFGGHSHDYTSELVRVGQTVIVNGGEKGPYLARLDVATGPDGRLDAESARFSLVPVTGDVLLAPDVEERLAAYRGSFPDAIVLGRTDVPWDMTKESLRQGESPVANLVNDRMRGKFGVEIVLNNAGAFRGKQVYQPGPVTDEMLREIDEFSNYAYSMTLDGKHIREILERSAASLGGGGLLHASGLRYTVDVSRTAQVVSKDDAGAWTIDVPGDRVTDVQVAAEDGSWEPLDPDRMYRVLSNSFLVKHEGDGYFWFKQYGAELENTYSTFYSILAEIAGNEGVLNPGAPDGRLTLTGR